MLPGNPVDFGSGDVFIIKRSRSYGARLNGPKPVVSVCKKNEGDRGKPKSSKDRAYPRPEGFNFSAAMRGARAVGNKHVYRKQGRTDGSKQVPRRDRGDGDVTLVNVR